MRRLPAHLVVNAANWSQARHEPEKILIARFDGLFAYRFTPAAVYNFVRANKLKALPRLAALEAMLPVSLGPIDHGIAAYLNRRDWPLKSRADAIVYQSRFSHRIHQEFARPDPSGTPVREIVNGVPLDIFCPRSAPSLRAGGPHLAITAQFRIGKRLRDAVLIINALRRTYPNALLHVIGDMDVLARESLGGLSMEACVLHGRVSSEALPDLYASMDVGLCPSLFDACPNSVIEMIACGLPVVTTTASGAAELVPDAALTVGEEVPLGFIEFHNYRRFPVVDVEAWCSAIEAVLQDKRRWRERCIEHARATFDIETVADRYAAVIELASEARSRRASVL
jgi:glycosyltransferase involved in cell wall biosynthesis